MSRKELYFFRNLQRRIDVVHILLTGGIQVGKTTIIKKFLLQSGLSADGFMTYWETDDDGDRRLYLSMYSTDTASGERHLLARSIGGSHSQSEKVSRVFDEYGAAILNSSGIRDIIIMDELGILESEAADFQHAVLRHMAGSVPVLGVIKPRKTRFLDTVRAQSNVTVREVTVYNRDSVLSWLLEENIASVR